MTLEELEAAFERHEDDFLKFDRIANPRSSRPDLHAFRLLSLTESTRPSPCLRDRSGDVHRGP